MAVANTQTRATVAAQAPTSMSETLSQRQIVLVMLSVLLGMLLAALDQTIVGTAMPRVIAELNGLEHYAWVFTAYLLASTVTVPIYGKLSDIYGRRVFFIGGMIVFLIGSALSGMSQDMPQLILFRAIQGLGAGGMMPIAMAIVGDLFPPSERGKWQGLMTAVFGLATIIGPTAGGWITDNWGWRWVFYVNMPLGAIAIIAAYLMLPKHSRHRSHQIDYLGAATLVAGTVPLLLAFSWAGTDYAWTSPQVIGLLAFAVAMLAFFIWIETRAAEPIIAPRHFRNSIFTISVIATFLLSVGMFGATLYLPLFVQAVIGTSATNSGVVLAPMMIGFMASSIVGGQLLSRTGRYRIIAIVGFGIAAIGMWLLAQLDVTATEGLVVRNMVVIGLGIGALMSLFTIVVQNAFPFSELGQVTASLTFFRSIGGTMGAAILGSMMVSQFQSALAANMPAALKQAVPAERLAALQNPQVLLSPEAMNRIQQSFSAFGPQGQQLFTQLMQAIRVSLASAIINLYWVGFGAMLVALVASFFLKEIPLRKSHRAEEATPQTDGQLDADPGVMVEPVL
ncbi:MAG: MFS transporter [Chloroflexi bacterium]|nr:MFS transporter [Chloroflexota bacterium]